MLHSSILILLIAGLVLPPMGQNSNLISYGPHLGGKASEEFSRWLAELGLKFVDEYSIFDHHNIPEFNLFSRF